MWSTWSHLLWWRQLLLTTRDSRAWDSIHGGHGYVLTFEDALNAQWIGSKVSCPLLSKEGWHLSVSRWPRLRHEKPKDHDREQGHRCDTQKCRSATETRRYDTEEGSAQRSADSGPRSHDALGQVEATGAAGDIGDDQRRQHAQHRSADGIEQLKSNDQRRVDD